MKKTKFLIIFSLAICLALPIAASAFAVKSDTAVYVAKGETIEGDLYAAGQSITVDGKINGDLICAGQSVNVNGDVEGDVICAGQSVNVNGKVGGNVRVAGNAVNINNEVGRNVNALGASIVLGKDAKIGWSMLFAGTIGEIRGKISGNLTGIGSEVVISGDIAKDVKLKLNNHKKDKGGLAVTSNAKIGGNINYTDKNEASFEQGATVAGEINQIMPKIKEQDNKENVWGYGLGVIYSIFASLVIGLVLISFWGKQTKKITDKMLAKAGASIGWGIIVMFIAPILALFLILTLIGIPLAALLIGVWLIAICLSKILVGILIGRSILEKIWKKRRDSLLLAMVIGIILVKLIVALPLFGWILGLLAIWWGLGGFWLYFRKA